VIGSQRLVSFVPASRAPLFRKASVAQIEQARVGRHSLVLRKLVAIKSILVAEALGLRCYYIQRWRVGVACQAQPSLVI